MIAARLARWMDYLAHRMVAIQPEMPEMWNRSVCQARRRPGRTVAVDGPGPTTFVQQVPEPKVTKNRVHVDLETGDRPAEVQRLTKLGASVLDSYDGWTVMLDPEGNEFCVSDRG